MAEAQPLSPTQGAENPIAASVLTQLLTVPHNHQTKAQEWDYKGSEWPLAPMPQLS